VQDLVAAGGSKLRHGGLELVQAVYVGDEVGEVHRRREVTEAVVPFMIELSDDAAVEDPAALRDGCVTTYSGSGRR